MTCFMIYNMFPSGPTLNPWDQLHQIGPRAVVISSYLLSAIQVYTTTHCMFYREQLSPASPKGGPSSYMIWAMFPYTICNMFPYIMFDMFTSWFVICFSNLIGCVEFLEFIIIFRNVLPISVLPDLTW